MSDFNYKSNADTCDKARARSAKYGLNEPDKYMLALQVEQLLNALEDTRDLLIAYRRDFNASYSDQADMIIKRGYKVITEGRAQ